MAFNHGIIKFITKFASNLVEFIARFGHDLGLINAILTRRIWHKFMLKFQTHAKFKFFHIFYNPNAILIS